MNAQTSVFDSIATYYDRTLPAHVTHHYLRMRVAFLVSRAGKRGNALDVGCGTGVLAEALAQDGWTVVGADRSMSMLRVMRNHRWLPIQTYGNRLSVVAEWFELVYSVATLHHIAERDVVRSTLLEMYRVCKPGGVVVVWDHNPLNPYWPVVMARVPQDTGSERLIPPEEICDVLAEQAETQSLQVFYKGFVPDFAPRALLPIFRLLERGVERHPALGRRLCAHNVIVMRKRAHRSAAG